MATRDVTRRLAAILVADVVGYSRLMEADEEGTLARLKAHQKELIEPKIAEHKGRLVKTTGDGILVEFASVVEATRCAVEVQEAMAERNADVPEEERIAFRVGINLGDIIVEDDDIYGDGVNVAARLEGLAEPGGICLSQQAFDHVETKLDLSYEDQGDLQVKNITRPVRVYRVALAGSAPSPVASPVGRQQIQQEIRFCMTPDGVQIAYATVGQGPPLVKTANWLNHLEYDWESPVWRHLNEELARDHLFVRYDERGTGLSDWDVEDMSLDSWVADLETLVDAAGLDRFALLGISQGCAVSIAYATRHPDRVSHLVLYGGYARGRRKRGSADKTEQVEAIETLMRHGWGKENPALRQMFTSAFIPGATLEQMRWFNDLQRISTTGENAVRLQRVFENFDVGHLLSKVTVPTLVLHCRDDAAVRFEEGRRMAAMIPGARFVALEGQNHLILEDDPAWPRFLEEVRSFLGVGVEDTADDDPSPGPLADDGRLGAQPGAPLPLPDKPSIAVLPFENMSGDPEQEYFADGIAEDIITALSALRWLFVIARNSSFTYKGKAVDVTEVARDLGVRYVLEGSVRKAGERVRISAQLIDATTGNHVWAQRYDRRLEDIFELQDEITQTIVAAIEPEVATAERERATRKPPDNLDAWEAYQRGLWHHYHFTPEELVEAKRFLRRAIELDPAFASAYAGLAFVHYHEAAWGNVEPEEAADSIEQGLEIATKAIALDNNDALAHGSLGRLHVLKGDYQTAAAELERARDLNPNSAMVYVGLAAAEGFTGRAEDGIAHAQQALRLSPRDPLRWGPMVIATYCLIRLRRYDEALDWARRTAREPHAVFWPYAHVVVCLVELDRMEEARQALTELLRIEPGLSASKVEKSTSYITDRECQARYFDALRKAGLPE